MVVSTPARSIVSGSVIGGRYEILDTLGAGGMATVYKARDRALDVSVALKILKPSPDPELARRFRSEIKLAWRVRHRNVCGIHEYGEDGDVLYISMELVEGKDLRRLLRESGPLVWEEAYDVAIQIAEGLEAIHDAGVIHRDLKPANITRDARGLVRLMDFGIAKVWGEESDGSTGTGHVVGSPLYMSPEQVRGASLDFRSDLYAMGLVVYELFTGTGPFHGVMGRLESEPDWSGPAARQIPAAAMPILKRVLARDPGARHSSCTQLLAELRAARAAIPRQSTDPETAPTDELGAATGSASSPPVPIFSRAAQARLLVAPLVKATKHAQVDVRLGAVQSLGRIGVGGLLASPRARVAAEALGAAHREDSDERVRAAAAQALVRIERLGKTPPPPPVPRPPVPRPVPPPGTRVPDPVSLPPTSTRLPRPSRSTRPASCLVRIAIPVVVLGVAVVVRNGVWRPPPERAPQTTTPPTLPPSTTTEPESTPSVAPATTVTLPAPSVPPTPRPPRAIPTRPASTIPPPPSTQPSPETEPPPGTPPTSEPDHPTTTIATTEPPPTTAPPTPEPIVGAKCLSCPIPEPAAVLCARLGLACTANLRVQVSEAGEVLRVEYLAGPGGSIRKAIIEAVQRWRYRPAQRGEQPVASFVLVDLKL